MREYCVHLSILAQLVILFNCCKQSEVNEKHSGAGVHKMPFLSHTEWLWKLCTGHHLQQNQMILRVAAELFTVGYFWNWSHYLKYLEEFLVSWAPETPLFPALATAPDFLVTFWHTKLVPRWLSSSEDGEGNEIPLGSLAVVWPSTRSFWQGSSWRIKVPGIICFPSVLLEKCPEWTMEEWHSRWEAQLQTMSRTL